MSEDLRKKMAVHHMLTATPPRERTIISDTKGKNRGAILALGIIIGITAIACLVMS